MTLRVVGCQVFNKGNLASHCHGNFMIAKGKYLLKGEKIRKKMEEMNDSHCLFLLLPPLSFKRNCILLKFLYVFSFFSLLLL